MTWPRLTWLDCQNTRSGYQIQVAQDIPDFANPRMLRWDSGKVCLKQSDPGPIRGQTPGLEAHVLLEGPNLGYQGDRRSPWSTPALWEMGLLNPSDWTARWIGGRSGVDHDSGRRRFPLAPDTPGRRGGALIQGPTYW